MGEARRPGVELGRAGQAGLRPHLPARPAHQQHLDRLSNFCSTLDVRDERALTKRQRTQSVASPVRRHPERDPIKVLRALAMDEGRRGLGTRNRPRLNQSPTTASSPDRTTRWTAATAAMKPHSYATVRHRSKLVVTMARPLGSDTPKPGHRAGGGWLALKPPER